MGMRTGEASTSNMARILCVVLSVIGIGLAVVLSDPSESCSCGKKGNNDITNHTRPKIIKGQDADLNEYPWMVWVYCGAVVINSKWILTAKHCIGDGKYTASLGEWDINNQLETESRKDFEVVNIVRHPDVDLALLEVEGDIDLSIYTPICLPKPGFDVRGKRVTLAGWGNRCDCGGVSCDGIDLPSQNILQEADVPIFPCPNTPTDYICYGGEDGKIACSGDSGSPVIYNDNGKWTLVAVNSGIFHAAHCNCMQVAGPEVAKFVKWIEDNTKGATSCKD